ncbi:ribosomal protection-like ABC-F family protein [Pedobacter kyonggii]|uniref:ABC-F family ATP-binding cassette domain-containing protein n=1 Tax=Pedobacter kyonggii TaxID=1926871 RepID=A0A4V2JH10_9SPHI|nr:ABC-F family ATP-binding cassette domain-containing protein [Pedobacter kyonggii]TBO43143.1 ABC-F family ATP-binding cassette domain-containing protein [Pedobacter kyonggii]
MLILQGANYIHPNGDLLLSDLNLTINKYEKIALIGHNGAGKSTLLKILSGKLRATAGYVKTESVPYYVPQLFGQFNDFTVAQALRIEDKLKALNEILNGEVTDKNLTILNDDWTIEERCAEALSYWRLEGLDLNQKMESLSGGQKTSVFLAGIAIHRPDIVLMDEPTNHLDLEGRNRLYDYIRSTRNTLVVVSHDRTLLNQIEKVCELSKRGITIYGGNYDFYTAQKKIENNALNNDLKAKEKSLRKAKEVERESIERQQKLDAKGKKKQEKAGLPTISMNTLKNNAEKSTAKLKAVHTEKLDHISSELNQLRSALPDADKMKIGFNQARLHKGKSIVEAKEVNFAFHDQVLWKEPLSFQIFSAERYVIKGRNGSGKTTLIKLILRQLQPSTGSLNKADVSSMYIDQDYSLVGDQLTVYEQAQQYNSGALQEHEIKIRLNRFLFGKTDWDKPCSALSGGEKMRLILCSLTISNQSPDLIILDEPTNNLDIQNIEILTAAINEYQGTLLVVSHDEYFLKQIYVEHTIDL